MEAIHTEEFMGYTIKLVQDEHCDCNPRDWDNLGTMVCWHRSYNLGDWKYCKDRFAGPDDFREFMKSDKPIALPLYLMDHSSISMSTKPFGCPWDSGQIGWIYVDLSTVKQDYECKQVTPTIRRRVKMVLESEVAVYDAHIQNECYGFEVTDREGCHVDSCYGYHGWQRVDWDYALGTARDAAQAHHEVYADAHVASGI